MHPAWREWSPEAFAAAATEKKPILLSIVTAWSEECAAMDRTTYADPEVVSLVDARFVPIRVDADRRPDVSDRYNLGGWPTTAFVTPEGDMLGGGTYLSARDMVAALTRVARASFDIPPHPTRPDGVERSGGVERQGGVRLRPDRVRTSDADLRSAADDFRARLLDQFDPMYGGFGSAPKLPHPYALQCAVAFSADGEDELLARVADVTIEGMTALWDADSGGFPRYADREDWSQPGGEKLLEDHAALLHAYVEAAIGRREGAADRAAALVRWVRAALIDPQSGGFFNARTPHLVDRTLYVDRNAMMVGALIRAAALFEDVWLRDAALNALEAVVVPDYVPGDGVAHVVGGPAPVRGLLTDQVHAAGALIWAHAATGLLPYSMLAAELMEWTIRKMWDEDAGCFRDRVQPEDPLRPFEVNCHAACVLDRLAVLTGNGRYHERARAILDALAPAFAGQELFGAPYVLAIREVIDRRPPAGLQLSKVDWHLT